MQKTRTLLFVGLSLITFNTFASQISELRAPTAQDIHSVKVQLLTLNQALLSCTTDLTRKERKQLLSPKNITQEKHQQLVNRTTLTPEGILLLRDVRKGLKEISRL